MAAADLREMMLNHPGSSSTKEIDELIEEADSNGDGQVNYIGRTFNSKITAIIKFSLDYNTRGMTSKRVTSDEAYLRG